MRKPASSIERELSELKFKYQQFAHKQMKCCEIVIADAGGLYLSEIAKGVGEPSISTQFLSYRTDDIRPYIFNRWRTWLAGLGKEDPVFGPWLEMQSWGAFV